MNDFTKEELKLLFGGLQLWMKEIYPENQADRDFRNKMYQKIQSMIDNYCEHEFYVQGCEQKVFGQCSKCGEVKRLIRT